MTRHDELISRRRFVRHTAAVGAGLAAGDALRTTQAATKKQQALISITLDLEMMARFPTWDQTHWNYHKGDLDEAAKRYSVAAARRVKARGGVIHFFVVGRVFEQPNVDWIKELVEAGHPLGNHTYDHVYVLAKERPQVQFLFERAPWLIEDMEPREAIEKNVRMCTAAIEHRIGIKPDGFRTPGGFANAMNGREDIQQMLLDCGFPWVSCKYPHHPVGEVGAKPTKEILDAIVKSQAEAQPFVYPTGLVDVPMSPISDVNAFRRARWGLADFLHVTRMGVEWAIEHGASFDFLGHPSCLGVVDPEFRTIDLICDLVEKAGDRAAIVDVGTIAARVKDNAG
jgi:peptidoglycan/xylan/chitin deacetylase (PgdA/CDA1 family)